MPLRIFKSLVKKVNRKSVVLTDGTRYRCKRVYCWASDPFVLIIR